MMKRNNKRRRRNNRNKKLEVKLFQSWHIMYTSDLQRPVLAWNQSCVLNCKMWKTVQDNNYNYCVYTVWDTLHRSINIAWLNMN